MTADTEVDMKAAGFEWDPSHQGYPRWTHTKTGVTALRQPYMTDQQWEEHKRKKVAEVSDAQASDLYYLQVRGYVGNSLLWWREGKHGYTTDIKLAHVFTKEEAFRQAEVRPTEDFPWRKDYIDQHLQHHVSSEKVSRKDRGAI